MSLLSQAPSRKISVYGAVLCSSLIKIKQDLLVMGGSKSTCFMVVVGSTRMDVLTVAGAGDKIG